MSKVRFDPFSSAVDPSFWSYLSKLKLEVYKLSETPLNVFLGYTTSARADAPCRTQATAEYSFPEGKELNLPPLYVAQPATLYNFNTIEAFKAAPAADLMMQVTKQIWASIASGEVFNHPGLLNQALLLSFADLKSHAFTYMFGFPALTEPGYDAFVLPYGQQSTADASTAGGAQNTADGEAQFVPCSQEFTAQEQASLAEQFAQFAQVDGKVSLADRGMFVIQIIRPSPESSSSSRSFKFSPLSVLPELAKSDPEARAFFLAFIDPSAQPMHPGWPLRNTLVLASLLGFTELRVVAWRNALAAFEVPASAAQPELLGATLIGRVAMQSSLRGALLSEPSDLLSKLTFKSTGWEKTDGKIVSRRVDLSGLMDPTKVMESSVSLNLKLMRWRMLPGLDVARLNKTKVLLVGSGTLGCNVARALLGWGIFNITFVDSGRVSFSNPVRQTLFTFEDAKAGRLKAEAAAARVLEIYPGAVTRAEVLTVPMPGHMTSTSEQLEQALSHAQRLSELIQTHDATFLLTDSRESRWLPALLCQAYDKICINAALGFDSYLVMRHGTRNSNHPSSPARYEQVEGEADISHHTSDRKEEFETSQKSQSAATWNAPNVGCYFCSDVTAPGNTQKDRTLDQQCTVTRPGLSFIASALAAELFVALLHNQHGYSAPAHVDRETAQKIRAAYSQQAKASGGSAEDLEEDTLSGGLGVIPHQMRGFFHDFSQKVMIGHPFESCPGCGTRVLKALKEQGLAKLLTDVMNISGHLEEISGLADLRRDAEVNFEAWDDEALLEELDAEDDDTAGSKSDGSEQNDF